MDSIEPNCKHNRLPRNCYLCYLHRHDHENYKTHLDTIHETISELKIRLSKLEEYKRLQDDLNAGLREDVRYLVKEKIILEKRCEEVSDWIIRVEKDLTLRVCELEKRLDECIGEIGLLKKTKVSADLVAHHHIETSARLDRLESNQLGQQLDPKVWVFVNERLDKIETQLKNQGDINVILLDKFKSVIKNEIAEIKENTVSTPIKTTGLTFEEAITAFKASKKIRFHDSMSESTIYEPKAAWGFGFDYDKICRDHWEIIE